MSEGIQEVANRLLSDETEFNRVTDGAFQAADQGNSGSVEKRALLDVMIQVAAKKNVAIPSREELEGIVTRVTGGLDGALDLQTFKNSFRAFLEGVRA